MELPVKERLVGAAILVGLIVVLVPEMLSGPKDAETAGGTADDGSMRTYTIDLSGPQSQTQPEPTSGPGDPLPQPPLPQPEVKPEVSPPPPPKPAATPASGWAVQLGSFASADNAKKLAGELRSKGYQAFVSSTGSGKQARHRVRVGPVASRPQAEKLAQRLKRDGRQGAIVSP